MATREHETKHGVSFSPQQGYGGGPCATWQISCQEVSSVLVELLAQSNTVYGQQTLFPFRFPPDLVVTGLGTQTHWGSL